MTMKIGVTGATGTIGFAFCRQLQESMARVNINALCRKPSFPDQAQKYATVKEGLQGIKWVETGIETLNPATLRQLTDQCQVIAHFAGWVAHKIPEDQAGNVIKLNVLWPAILSLLARESGATRFLYASTRMIYGFIPKTPEGEKIKAAGLTEEALLDLSEYKSWMETTLPEIPGFAADYVRGSSTNIDSFVSHLLQAHPIPNGTRDLYGLSKYMGELEVLKKSETLIMRTNIFGWNIQEKYSIAEWILNELSNKKQIKGFRDAYFSSIYNFDLAEILDIAIDQDLTGLFNCGSSTSVSKYEFALQIADRFKLDKDLIHPISIDDFDFKEISLDLKLLSDSYSQFFKNCGGKFDEK